MENMLSKDGTVYYYGCLWNEAACAQVFSNLLETIDWQHDSVMIYGKKIITKRKTAWYGNPECSYRYSHITRIPLEWTTALLALKARLEQVTRDTFNACLLNLYHHGGEGMGWHSDNERELAQHGSIASLSFGAARKFEFKHRATGEIKSLSLQNGSLLIMKGATQTYWQHRLPPEKAILTPRINLTFRTIVPATNRM